MYYNIKVGLIGQWKKCIFILCMMTFFSFAFWQTIQDLISLQAIPDIKIGILDYYIHSITGELPATGKPDIPYFLPTTAVILWIFASFLTGHFPSHELQMCAEHTVLRAKSRFAWWNAKCLWNFLAVLLFYSLLLLGAFLLALFTNTKDLTSFEWIFHQKLFLQEPSFNISFWAAIFLIPIICTVAMTQIQMTLSLFIGSNLSYIVMIIYFICCAYFQSPFLIGNGMMLIRNQQITSTGISSLSLFFCALIYWIIFYTIGCFFFQRYVIIKKLEG